MSTNPWLHPFLAAPYVLPEDRKPVEGFNAKVDRGSNRFLEVDAVLPEPFMGDPNAPVVLLSNNPGYGEKAHHKTTAAFMNRMRGNLRHEPTAYPFLYLDPAFSALRGWWAVKLKGLLNHFKSDEIVARSIFEVVHFPYPSRRYGHGSLRLPSQDYGYGLVKAAMNRGAVVVLMRGEQRWLKAIPELNGYAHRCDLRNPQCATISERNCRNFKKIVEAIEAAEEKRLAAQANGFQSLG